MKRSKRLAILCKNELSSEEMEKCGYKTENIPKHPFEFYGGSHPWSIKITTHPGAGVAESNLKVLTARLYGLSRDSIRRGQILSIPETTCVVIRSIAANLLGK